jgi:hypothetical protein
MESKHSKELKMEFLKKFEEISQSYFNAIKKIVKEGLVAHSNSEASDSISTTEKCIGDIKDRLLDNFFPKPLDKNLEDDGEEPDDKKAKEKAKLRAVALKRIADNIKEGDRKLDEFLKNENYVRSFIFNAAKTFTATKRNYWTQNKNAFASKEEDKENLRIVRGRAARAFKKYDDIDKDEDTWISSLVDTVKTDKIQPETVEKIILAIEGYSLSEVHTQFIEDSLEGLGFAEMAEYHDKDRTKQEKYRKRGKKVGEILKGSKNEIRAILTEFSD